MEQLREEVKILEENIDQSILREEAAVNGTAAPEDADVKSMKRKFEVRGAMYDIDILLITYRLRRSI